jgi:hypothetical protein
VKEQPELFARGLCEMGYRLVPMKVMFPDTIRAGEAFDVEMTWVNRAVGRAMRDFHLRLRLDDAVCDAGALPTSQWIRGETYTTTSKAKFDAIAPGKHVLRFELIDPRDGRVITLPLKSNELGTIEVTK